MAFFIIIILINCSDCSAIGTGAEGVAWVVLSLAGEGAAG